METPTASSMPSIRNKASKKRTAQAATWSSSGRVLGSKFQPERAAMRRARVSGGRAGEGLQCADRWISRTAKEESRKDAPGSGILVHGVECLGIHVAEQFGEACSAIKG
jgi:hypothetical protein